jgi:DNA-directed RNA polymerase subunit RPC12/RpoP
MSQGARDLLTRGIAAAKAQDNNEARFFLEWVLRSDADRQQRAQAWLWLSGIAEDVQEKRNCLEEALALDPANQLARRGMAILEGRLNPAEIIDPERLPPPPSVDPPQSVNTQRFICQKCSGKMAFKPDGKSLRCEYCSHKQTLFAAMAEGTMVQEHDFTVAMATAKGHTLPVETRPFTCQGCGASFLIEPDVLSLNCTYCGSSHVVELPESRRLIPPEGIIPLEVSQQEARNALWGWFAKKGLQGKAKVTPLRGVYVPAWTFDLCGEIRWQCYAYRDEGPSIDLGGLQVSLSGSRRTKKLVRETGNHLVYEDDILVPASHKLPSELIMSEAKRFLLSDLVPYEQGYLADWPAAVYEITVSDASLVARRAALENARRTVKTRLNATLGYVKDLQLNTSGVTVETYKLILLPVWVARYRYQSTTYHVLVNGQTGKVRAQEPATWLRKLLGSLFN